MSWSLSVRYVRAQQYGTGSGNTWANAAPISDLNNQIAAAGPGGEVWLMAGDHFVPGSYPALSNAGISGSPVKIRGANFDGRPGFAFLHGDRRSPYDGTQHSSLQGTDGFQLNASVSFLTFDHLALEDMGSTGCFYTPFGNSGWIDTLTLSNIQARNVHRLFNAQTGSPTKNLTIDGLRVKGFSKACLQFKSWNQHITIKNFDLDGDRQWGDSWSSGIVFGVKTYTESSTPGSGANGGTPEGQLVSGTNVLYSPTFNFDSRDVGNQVASTGNITPGTTITGLVDPHTVTLSTNALATTTTADVSVFRRNSDLTIVNGRVSNTFYELDPTNDTGTYWNSDAIAAEGSDDTMLVQDVVIENSTDGGIDVKATNLVCRRVKATACKRNFRLWQTDSILYDCESYFPTLWGGSGSRVHVWSNSGGGTIYGGIFDNGPAMSGPMFENDGATPIAIQGRAKLRRPTGAPLINTGTVALGSQVRQEYY